MNGIDIKCREILPISPIEDFSRRNHLLSNNKFDNVASSASLTRTRSAKSPDTKFFKFHFTCFFATEIIYNPTSDLDQMDGVL